MMEANIDNPVRFTENMAFETGARQRVRVDLDNMELRLAEAGLLDDDAKAKIQAIGQKIPRMYENLVNPNDVKAVFPLGLQHEQAEVWALNSKLMERVGYKKPFVWKNNRWKNLDINEIPKDSGIRSIEVEMMRNEVRGETFNICNPTGARLDGRIVVEGIPEEANLIVNEVLFTDTAIRKPVSDAIVPLDSDSPFALFAGCNKQIWLSFKRPACKAGVYDGRIKITAGGQMVATIPLKLKIYDMDFPRQPSIHLGGWDYTNMMGKYYNTPNCVEATIAIMKDTYVDSPWATNAVMPKGATFDNDGHLQNPKGLDFSAWDKWTNMWNGARKYCVFWSIGDKFNGVPPSDPRFANMVKEYVNAWMAYVKQTGFNPKDVVVLLYDEPSREEQAKKIMAWARPIKERCPEFTIFEDPCFNDPRPVDPEFFKLNDVLCPMTRMIHAMWKFPQEDPNFNGNFRDFYVQSAAAFGETLQTDVVVYIDNAVAVLIDRARKIVRQDLHLDRPVRSLIQTVEALSLLEFHHCLQQQAAAEAFHADIAVIADPDCRADFFQAGHFPFLIGEVGGVSFFVGLSFGDEFNLVGISTL
jgi:hypothetical protein